MILNGDGHGGIIQANILGKLSKTLPSDYPVNLSGNSPLAPSTIFTNPPFGASHELRERSPEVLDGFELGHVWVAESDGWLRQTESLNVGEGVPPEILFLERCIRVLRPGGRLAIVIARGVLDNREAISARQYILENTKLLAVINCHPNTFAPFNGTKAAVLILEKKASRGIARDENYKVFMAISQKVGQDSQGHEIFQTDANGEMLLRDGQPVRDHDLETILSAWRAFLENKSIEYEAAWTIDLSRILDSEELRLNPTRFAPGAERALARVLELADTSDWTIERLGDIATVFNGPRFKRPFAEEGVTSGSNIVPMYTPRGFFEAGGESLKYLDLNRASRTQLRQLEALKLDIGWIMVVDSGTSGKLLGRVGMTNQSHKGAIGNNNMIRIVIADPVKRDYVYQFLKSELGKELLLRNVYGTNQDHIEPDDVKDTPIPLPRDYNKLQKIHERVYEAASLRERANRLESEAEGQFASLFNGVADEDSK